VTQDPALMKKVYYISPELSRFLHADSEKHELNIINMGVIAFLRNQAKQSANVECIFRICQDGLTFLAPQMKNRILFTDDLDSFKHLIMQRYHQITDVPSKELGNSIDKLGVGCFVVVYRKDGNIEPVTMYRFTSNFSAMISKENLFSLHMRYLSSEQRARCADVMLPTEDVKAKN